MRLAAFLAAVAVVALVAAAAPRPAHTGAQDAIAAGITVSGLGSVTTTPDRAQFEFGVQSRGRTATETLAANSAEVRKVIAALKGAGVADADIQTSQVSLQPRSSQDGETIVGYVATNSLSAKLKDLAKAGAVVDAAVAAGANTVYGPSLVRGDTDALYKQALQAAMADARAKAQTIAQSANATLGRVTSVVEGGGAPTPQPLGIAAPRTDVPIQPGTQQVHATVTVVFAIS
jgi:uncharacterized protein YggE